VERAHRDQLVGAGKTVILIDPSQNKVGFNCLSDECEEHTFGGLRKLLEERTGRPTPQIATGRLRADHQGPNPDR